MSSGIEHFSVLVKRTRWYRQGGAAVMWYVSPPWSIFTIMTAFGRRISVTFRGMVGHNAGNFFTMYWPVNMMHRVAGYYLRRQLRDGGFIRRLRLHWIRVVRSTLEQDIIKLRATNLWRLTDSDLRRLFHRFMTQYRLAWSETIFHDAFDLVANDIVRREFLVATPRVSMDHLEILLAPVEPSVIQRERIELAGIAAQTLQNPRLNRLVRLGAWAQVRRDFPLFHQRIVIHQTDYAWMYNDYEHVMDVPVSSFCRRIRNYVLHPEELRRDRSLLSGLRRIRVRKLQLIRSLRLSSRQRKIIELLSTVQVWRDERKAMSQRAHTAMRQFGKECLRRGRLTRAELRCAFWWEMAELLHPTARFRRMLKTRTKGIVFRAEGVMRRILTIGSASAAYRRLLDSRIGGNELLGMAAFPGIVRGRARIVLKQADFHRFKHGEILIAPNTRPEYVPIMKKACAVVAEEGGITSHTAIVARELKIPAIVGVQGILDSVKDGDLIEVDATKGVVRRMRQ